MSDKQHGHEPDLQHPIVVQNLTKRFGEFVAVDDVSFCGDEGEDLWWPGPDRAGKTGAIPLSLRGRDNATYYRPLADDRARYVDDSGCGNTLALDRAPVLRLAMDVLRYYALAAGVDGFRFDLATTLGRRDDGFDPGAPLLQAIAQDPVLRDLKLIACLL